MNIFEKDTNVVEITKNQHYTLCMYGAVDTGKITLFSIDSLTTICNLAVARLTGTTSVYLVHIKVKEV